MLLGDRIISVNGESVSGKSYAEVVGLIQRLRDNLSLVVVPKQDDILQMVSSGKMTSKQSQRFFYNEIFDKFACRLLSMKN